MTRGRREKDEKTKQRKANGPHLPACQRPVSCPSEASLAIEGLAAQPLSPLPLAAKEKKRKEKRQRQKQSLQAAGAALVALWQPAQDRIEAHYLNRSLGQRKVDRVEHAAQIDVRHFLCASAAPLNCTNFATPYDKDVFCY